MDVSPRLRAGLRAFGALTGLALLAYVAHTAFGLGSPELDGFFEDWVYCGLIVAAGVVLRHACRRGPGGARGVARDGRWASWPGPPGRSPGRSSTPTSGPALPVGRRRALPRVLSRELRVAAPARPLAHRHLPQQPLARRSDSGAHRRRADRHARLPADRGRHEWRPRGDRGEPRVSGRGPAAARAGRGGLRTQRVAARPGLAPARRRPGAHRGRGRRSTSCRARPDQYVQGTLLDLAWPASALLVAVAAWQPARKKITIQDWLIVAVPVGCGLVAVQLLVYDHFEQRELRRGEPRGVGRCCWRWPGMALAFLENQRTLNQTHIEARTDSLTGLKNRRSLMADLELQLELASVGRAAGPAAVRPRRLQGVQRHASATPRATGSSRGSRRAWRTPSAPPGTPTASVATSSARSCPHGPRRDRRAARSLLGSAQ